MTSTVLTEALIMSCIDMLRHGGSEAVAKAAAIRKAQGGEFDHPELRPLGERCITSFGNNAGPPMLPNYFYNNNYSIVQSKDTVVILT